MMDVEYLEKNNTLKTINILYLSLTKDITKLQAYKNNVLQARNRLRLKCGDNK